MRLNLAHKTQELRKSGKKKKLEWINHELPFQAWPYTCTSLQAKPARPQAQGARPGQGSLEKSRGFRNHHHVMYARKSHECHIQNIGEDQLWTQLLCCGWMWAWNVMQVIRPEIC